VRAWRELAAVVGGLRGECQVLRARHCRWVRRGVAPAGSVLELVRSCTLPDGAGEARGSVRPAEARRGQEARGQEAIERDPAKG
jgi:hypothetical protein